MLYLLVIAGAIWFVLEHTATGRRLYATGFNPDAARLAGVRTDRLRFLSLITSALLAGVAGIVFASAIGSGSPTAGDAVPAPAFAAAFLGATQLRGGRFNAWGTVIAVLLLGTGHDRARARLAAAVGDEHVHGNRPDRRPRRDLGPRARAAADAPPRRRQRLTGPAGTTTPHHPQRGENP